MFSVRDALLQCLKKMTLSVFSFFLSSINTFPLYLTLLTDSFLCPLHPFSAYIHPHPWNTYLSLSLYSVHPAPVREERQPEQLPAQCVQPSQHPHWFSQPPTLCHAQWGCGSHSCCPHPTSARPAPSGPCRWHLHPPEEAWPLQDLGTVQKHVWEQTWVAFI